MIRITKLLILVALLHFVPIKAEAAKRVALVIGNSAYEHVPELANPRNDAEAMAGSLERLGFEVIAGFDLDRPAFRSKVREFSRAIRGAEMTLFYYAGHGLQVDGRNYLAPIETQLLDEAELDFETLPLEMIMKQMEREPRTNLVFLDACRNNPLARNLARSMGTRAAGVGRGLAPIETGIGTLIAFATQPGNVALDGDTSNSPFTRALVKHIETPGEDIAVLLRTVRQEVITETGGRQVPWSNSSLTGSVILKEKPFVAPETDRSVEIAFWNSIKDSDERELYEAYLRQFGNGAFAELARMRIVSLERRAREEMPSASVAKEGTVGEKADEEVRIASVEPPAEPEKSEIDPRQDRELVRSIQNELNRIGCSAGTADGIWGRKSTSAVDSYGRHADVRLASLEPSRDLLEMLESEAARVCPLVCGRGLEEKNGQCVRVKREAKLPDNTSRSVDPSPSPKVTSSACPSNPVLASRQIASFGSIPSGQVVVRKHSCGATLRCVGGNNTMGFARRCSWQ